MPKPKFNTIDKRQKMQQNNKSQKKLKKIKLRPMTQAFEILDTQLNLKPKHSIKKYRPHIQKTKIGKMINDISQQKLYEKMIKIGSFPQSVTPTEISLTKQSFAKYLKNIYERQIRVIDFLQLKPTLCLTDYSNVCTKLKLMSIEHIIFMTFLFYDFNNDGYLCENDIRRMKTIVEKNKNYLIQQDLKLILNYKDKLRQKQLHQHLTTQPTTPADQQNTTAYEKKAQNQLNYLQLYRLPQITQSTYFSWLKKDKKRRQEQKQKQQQQLQAIQQKKNNIASITSQTQVPQFNSPQTLEAYPGLITKPTTQQNDKKYDLNPSILKFKNFHDQNTKVRKYLLGIKHNKTYISFGQFKSLYIQKIQPRKNSQLPSSLSIQNSLLAHSSLIIHNKLSKKMSNQVSVSSKRYQPVSGGDNKYSRVETHKSNGGNVGNIGNDKGMLKKDQILTRSFLWYDLMDKLAGVRYEYLKYQ